MNNLAQGCTIGRFQAREWVSTRERQVSTQDERRPICLACWKYLKFVKYFEILGKQIHLSHCPGKDTYSVKFSKIYLLSSNLYEFSKKGQPSYLQLQVTCLPKHISYFIFNSINM